MTTRDARGRFTKADKPAEYRIAPGTMVMVSAKDYEVMCRGEKLLIGNLDPKPVLDIGPGSLASAFLNLKANWAEAHKRKSWAERMKERLASIWTALS